jgi:drug/metabolite transporter (DMT)-like permease
VVSLFGPLAAFGSAVTWAFASVRYSQVSGAIGSPRVNLARAMIVAPFYLIIGLALHGKGLFDLDLQRTGWLLLSVMGSYAFADNLFFSATRRLGVPTALSIASTYPVWAVLVGVVLRGERFGLSRCVATAMCVLGVATLVRLAPKRADEAAKESSSWGFVLAGLTSVLWAVNSIAVKFGGTGLDVSQVNSIRYGFALLILVVVVRSSDRGRRGLAPARADWKALLPAIIADGVFGSSLYVFGLAHSDLAIGATLTSLAPLISVPMAIVLGEEKWSAPRLLAVTVTVAGAVMLVSAA